MSEVDDKIEAWSARFRLRFLHQVVTLMGFPLLALLASLYGNSLLGRLDKLDAGQSGLLTDVASIKTNIALANQNIAQHETRIAQLETWQRTFAGYERNDAPTSNYRGKGTRFGRE